MIDEKTLAEWEADTAHGPFRTGQVRQLIAELREVRSEYDSLMGSIVQQNGENLITSARREMRQRCVRALEDLNADDLGGQADAADGIGAAIDAIRAVPDEP